MYIRTQRGVYISIIAPGIASTAERSKQELTAQPIRTEYIYMNREIVIAEGTSRHDRKWKNITTSWRDLTQRLSQSTRTSETMNQYIHKSTDERDRVKDIGGFCGGGLTGPRRQKVNFAYKDLLTLDLDNATADTWTDIVINLPYASCVYSTHSSTADCPRLRLVMPLSRRITSADEYIATARKVAEYIGIETVDPFSFNVVQLMYWPSHCYDATPIYHENKTEQWLDVDAVLSEYVDWHDVSQWPLCPSENTVVSEDNKHIPEDPTTKTGIIGAFCRTYGIAEAIDKYLPDVYTSGSDGRYTYALGSSSNGMVIMNDGTMCYSHHATDPAAGRAQNAFDLVRIHKFGDLDKTSADTTKPTSMPSYKAMVVLCEHDTDVLATMNTEAVQSAMSDFAEVSAENDMDWVKTLDSNKLGLLPTINNFRMIMDNDPHLKNLGGLDLMIDIPKVKGPVPWDKNRKPDDSWTDADASELRLYIEQTYHINSKQNCSDAFNGYMSAHKFHPVRDYLLSLTWDGEPRIDTVLIDYLGAEDTPYTRAVTSKTLIAAVARAMNPGCKYDTVLMLTGETGAGKSTLVSRLGQKWFSDSVDTSGSGIGNSRFDQLRGVWIAEDSELSSYKKADLNEAKRFISSACDTYRKAYGQFTSVNPRQCIFIGTTNSDNFLHDVTGNRRYWPVEVHKTHPPDMNVWDNFTQEVVDQCFAEALVRYKNGESIYLDNADIAADALAQQERYFDDDPRLDMIKDYLDTKLPDETSWESMDLNARRSYLKGESYYTENYPAVRYREYVSLREICTECLGKDPEKLLTSDTGPVRTLMREMVDGWEWSGDKKRKFNGFSVRYFKRIKLS